MKALIAFVFAVVLGVALPCCGLFRKSDGAGSTSAQPSSAPAMVAESAGVAPLESPAWSPHPDPSFIGLPQGCSLGRPVRRAALPAGSVRFSAPAEGSELVVAIDTDGDDAVNRAGILDPEGRATGPFAWTVLGAPPVMFRGARGLHAVRTSDAGSGMRRAAIWTPPDRSLPLVEGDHLEIVDGSCKGSTCAILTTLASKSVTPGATLLIGDPNAPASTWQRVDLPGEEDDWAPFSIVDIDGGAVQVALLGRGKLGVWRVSGGSASRVGTVDTPLGVYDVALGETPIVIAPGESIDAECAKDGFAMKLLRTNGKATEIDAHVPPESVVVRRLDAGFIVGWLSPTRCRTRSRQTVRAFLLGRDGAPRSSTMAVTEADGFAISTHGSELDLWLAHQGELVWAKGACRFAEAP